jgi:succinyl-diaminopimelate desuccinylase
VQTLYQAYVKYTNDTENLPKTIGGGTYARALKQGVAFGMEMPYEVSQAHQKDEAMSIDTFLLAMAIYAEALMQLGNK